MSRSALLTLTLVAALAFGVPHAASADDGGDSTVRPEIGKPIEKAQRLQQNGDFSGALAALRKADAVNDKTPYEVYALELTRGSIAKQAGDSDLAVKSFEQVIPSSYAPDAQKNQLRWAIAVIDYGEKRYGDAETWFAAYRDAGGNDPALQDALLQCYYLNNDYGKAETAAAAEVDAATNSGKAPAQSALQIWAASAGQVNDKPGYYKALEDFAVYYPKPAYWLDLVHHAEAQPYFADRLTLDAERFSQAVGALTDPDDVTNFVQDSVQAGLPGEAVRTVDWAYQNGIFGTGPAQDRQARLKKFVATKAAADRQGLAGAVAEAQGLSSGDALVRIGFSYASAGDFDQGLPLIEQGIAKGNLKNPGEAELHLGIARLWAGKKDEAVQAFQSVADNDGSADLAHLWLLYAHAPTPSN